MFLKERKCVFINDGKVVMVSLSVVDTRTGEVFNEVGRATCDLDTDQFDLETGVKIARDRAMVKVAKKVLKNYTFASKTLHQCLKQANEDIDLLQGIIDSQLEVIER